MTPAARARLREAWRAHEKAASGILIDARDYYRAFYETASKARRSIVLLGWQFDSDVELLRGADLPPGETPESVQLLAFLERLCEANPALEIRVLAWDHSVVFAMERELLQKLWFNLRTSERFFFDVDATVPEYGAHHQKVAVIDGQVAFFGSTDLCQDRWDTSEHACDDPRRFGRAGKRCKPYHEVQAVVTGAPARSLLDLFVGRWNDARGEAIVPSALVGPADEPLALPHVTYPMPETTVSLYRQLPYRFGRPAVREVKELLVSAIDAAERCVYVEMQYVTSEAIGDALKARFADPSKPRLDVVLVVPHKPDALKEELAVGRSQAKLLAELDDTARRHGHAFGVYNVASRRESEEAFVYVHSKLMIVDDELLTLGSTNFTNRSMSLDSEVNGLWLAEPDGLGPTARAIHGLRARLLSEHVGHPLDDAFLRGVGLVARLDGLAARGRTRLRRHDLRAEESSALFEVVQEVVSASADPPHAPESRVPVAPASDADGRS